jgi:hypothetical protein
LQVLVDFHPVPLVQLRQQEPVELLQILSLKVEGLPQYEHSGEVFEYIGGEERAAFLIGPIELEGGLYLPVHLLQLLHQQVLLLTAFFFVVLDYACVDLQEAGVSEVEVLGYLFSVFW